VDSRFRVNDVNMGVMKRLFDSSYWFGKRQGEKVD